MRNILHIGKLSFGTVLLTVLSLLLCEYVLSFYVQQNFEFEARSTLELFSHSLSLLFLLFLPFALFLPERILNFMTRSIRVLFPLLLSVVIILQLIVLSAEFFLGKTLEELFWLFSFTEIQESLEKINRYKLIWAVFITCILSLLLWKPAGWIFEPVPPRYPKFKILRHLCYLSVVVLSLTFSYMHKEKNMELVQTLVKRGELVLSTPEEEMFSLGEEELKKASIDYLGLELQKGDVNLLRRNTSLEDIEVEKVFFLVADEYFSLDDIELDDEEVNSLVFEKNIGASSSLDELTLTILMNAPIGEYQKVAARFLGQSSLNLGQLFKKEGFFLSYSDPSSLLNLKSKNVLKFAGFSSLATKGERVLAFKFLKSENLRSELRKLKELENILIIITSPHGDGESYLGEDQFVNRLSPLIFISDLKLPKAQVKRLSGHEDLGTSLYNLIFSNKSYLSLGDDLFGQGNSNGVSKDFIADNSGNLYRSVFSPWEEKDQVERSEDKKYLYLRVKSSRILSKYILNMEYSAWRSQNREEVLARLAKFKLRH